MRLAAITTSLLAAACSLQSEELSTTSIECTTNEDGSTTCSENEDRPDGEDSPPEGDLTCSGTGCVSECQYSEEAFSCTITCENGLRCQSTCKEGACEISCDCPDGGGGGGCEGEPTEECCRENPDDPACQPPCPDGSEECHCQENPDDPACQPPCPDGSTDDQCQYCREHPEDPECAPACPPDDPECCREGEDCAP
jgi:hypothetical protein